MCSALVVFVVGGAARMDLHTLGNTSASRSLIPDAITLPGYLLLAIGLSGLARVRGRGRSDELDAMLDGVVAALAALTLAWVYLIDPALFQKHSPLPVRFVLACYPAMSVFLVAIAARIALSPGQAAGGGLPVSAGRDRLPAGRATSSTCSSTAGSSGCPPSLVDLPYALAFVFFGAHVLHPSMRGPVRAGRTVGAAPSAGAGSGSSPSPSASRRSSP